MAAIDFIKDRKYPRKKLLDATWDLRSGSLFLESSGTLVETGAVDWDRSRFLDQDFWAWVPTSGSYYVLDSAKQHGLPPPKVYKWGPLPSDPKDEDDT